MLSAHTPSYNFYLAPNAGQLTFRLPEQREEDVTDAETESNAGRSEKSHEQNNGAPVVVPPAPTTTTSVVANGNDVELILSNNNNHNNNHDAECPTITTMTGVQEKQTRYIMAMAAALALLLAVAGGVAVFMICLGTDACRSDRSSVTP